MYCRKRVKLKPTLKILVCICLLPIIILFTTTVNAAEKEPVKIEHLSLNRSVAYLGEEISADVTVSAQPSLRNRSLRLRYYLDKNEIGRQTITDFDSSGNAKTVFRFKDSPEGRYQFRVVLDIEGEESKSDTVSRQLAILSLPGGMTDKQFSDQDADQAIPDVSESGKPDLVPETITFNIASPRIGQNIRIKSRISNTGSVQADNVKIRFFINGQPYGKDIIMNIAAGSQADIETDFKPTTEGKKDILVLVNPDGVTEEESNRNNVLSKTLVVRPADEGKEDKEIIAAPGPETGQKQLANLVVYIETISGVHYTTDGQVRFYITNNSQTLETKPFIMGVQILKGKREKPWLMRQTVKSLKAGQTVTFNVNWPASQLATENLYVATVDIEGVVDETDVRDNHTRPFRVISTSANKADLASAELPPELPPEITINSPRQGERLTDDRQLTVDWNSSGNIGKRVRITVTKRSTDEKILSSLTSNDGRFTLDLSAQDAGEYILSIKGENGSITSKKRKFIIDRKDPVKTQRLVSPVSGTSYRGGQQIKIIWPNSIKKKPGLLVDLVLQERSSKRTVKLNQKPIAISDAQVSWQVPDDGSIFGVYSLRAQTLNGDILAVTEEIELLPNFVSFNLPDINGDKEEIKTDLEIARTNFKGANLEFLVMNNGPADISKSAMVRYNFTSYFVLKVPITTDQDIIVCHSNLLAELPQGEGQIISLGRDPDCPMGERTYGSKFVYVVTHFTIPTLTNQRLIDPKTLNNLSKFYWPN
jgi:hypothetical protein